MCDHVALATECMAEIVIREASFYSALYNFCHIPCTSACRNFLQLQYASASLWPIRTMPGRGDKPEMPGQDGERVAHAVQVQSGLEIRLGRSHRPEK